MAWATTVPHYLTGSNNNVEHVLPHALPRATQDYSSASTTASSLSNGGGGAASAQAEAKSVSFANSEAVSSPAPGRPVVAAPASASASADVPYSSASTTSSSGKVRQGRSRVVPHYMPASPPPKSLGDAWSDDYSSTPASVGSPAAESGGSQGRPFHVLPVFVDRLLGRAPVSRGALSCSSPDAGSII